MALKEAYTTQELAALSGVTRQAIEQRAARESWSSRPRAGRGGGKEWLTASMPEETRLAIRLAEERRAVEIAAESAPAPLPAPFAAPSFPAALDDRRREKALAKADLLRMYIQWQRKHGFTKAQKMEFIIAYTAGTWPKLRSELGELSWKSLERWKREQDRAGTVLALADKRGIAHRGRSLLTQEHRTIILGQILNPNAPKVGGCAREVRNKCKDKGLFVPSETTIRRFAAKYAEECFDEWTLWREGKKAWNDKCAISIVRNWDLVEVGDVVFADGHTLNFTTIDPKTGKPKRMTLLLFFDGASNCPLGWEVMPTENIACISSAFRRTCLMLGKFPRVVYLDNGKAFRAKFFKGCEDFRQAGFTGLYRDLGCEVVHAWPYHGQSKTVERFFGTLHDMEVLMPSYTGNDIAHKPAYMKRGEVLHRRLYDKMGGRPLTLEETHMALARWFDDYAARPQNDTHLRGRTPGEVFREGRGVGLTQNEINKMNLLMMQKTICTITKDGFRLHGRLFWHEELANRRHSILVRFDDVAAPYTALVYTLEGDFLCEARDREYYGIAHGIHPAAKHLGTEEQRRELDDALALKKRQERESSAGMVAMCEHIVLPETRARVAAIEVATPKAAVVPMREAAPAVTPEEEAEFERKKAEALAAMRAAPQYTISGHKRWRDAKDRYAYLFKTRYEQEISLVEEDAAWMADFEQTVEYERYLKRRYDGLRELYSRQRGKSVGIA